MKIVCCKKCGAKYQLEDYEDISAFECTSCTGELELCDDSKQNKTENFSHKDSHIVYCVDCGSKYSLTPLDNILDYECENCGGSLRYVDEEMNEDIDKIVKDHERNKELFEPKNDNKKSAKSFTHKVEQLFTENNPITISDEDIRRIEEFQREEVNQKTARTRIPVDAQRKFEKEFLVPKSNDYNVLAEFLKNEFFKGVTQYYGDISNVNYKEFTKKSVYANNEKNFYETVKHETEVLKDSKNIMLIVGAVLFVGSCAEIILYNSGIGIFFLFVGLITLCYGIYLKKDDVEVEKRSQIVRNHLLTLPEEYYVFYNVKVPGANKGINHLVIGPTGIYEILSKKYNPKSNPTEISTKTEEIPQSKDLKSFRYTIKQRSFSKDDKIKQESLSLGENLINFLNDNGIRNCFVEPLVGFVNENVVVINMPLTDEDLFIDELLHRIQYGSAKLNAETIDKCAVLLSKYAADCSQES